MTWVATAVLTDSTTITFNVGDRVWWSAGSFGSNVTVNAYQDSTHISTDEDVERCTVTHLHNTKYLDGTHVSIDGAGSTTLPISTSNCGLMFTFSDTSSIATSSTNFYAYDGDTDINPMLGVYFQAAEGGQSTEWINANGLGNALTLQNQSSSTSHNFFVATSVSPTSNGSKAGAIKINLTYV